MIKIVHAADLFRRPILAASMFRDRAAQFHHRLRWDAIRLDDRGLEFDDYDDLNPVYIIIEDENGEHAGSGRLMPTTGRTMIAEHFPDLTGGVALRSPLIWEVTRLCVSPRSRSRAEARKAPAAVLWGACDLALRSGVEFMVAVYYAPLQRFFQSAGFAPEVLGSRETPEGDILAGLWEITPELRDALAHCAGVGGASALQYFPGEHRFHFARAAAPAPRALPDDDEDVAGLLGRLTAGVCGGGMARLAAV